MTSVASLVTAPVVICDSSSEDEDLEPVSYNWQETRPVQYQVLDVFGDNVLQNEKSKTSESIIIEDDDDEVLVVGEEKPNGVTSKEVLVYGKITSSIVEGSLGGQSMLRAEQVPAVGADTWRCSYQHDVHTKQDPRPVNEPIVNLDPRPVSEPIVNLDPRPVSEPIVNLDPRPVSEPIVNLDPRPVSEPIVNLDPQPVSDPRPVSEPIMNLAFRDNMRWFMTPEDREIVPRWSTVQNGDMVDPLCQFDADSVDDAPVQYTTIEVAIPPPAPKTSKHTSAKKRSQSKQKKCSKEEEEFTPVQKPVKSNSKSKHSKKCLNEVSAKKSKLTTVSQPVNNKRCVKKKAADVVQKPVKKDSSKRLGKKRSGRTPNGIEVFSLPPCCVSVCYGMVHHGTRVECPRLVTPAPRRTRRQLQSSRQTQDRRKPQDKLREASNQTVSNLPNKERRADVVTASRNHTEHLAHREGGECGAGVGRPRFSRSAKTRHAVV